MPHIGIRRPFATGRLVSVSCNSRATNCASSENASKKSPNRKRRIACGCSSLSAWYWRIMGVSSAIWCHFVAPLGGPVRLRGEEAAAMDDIQPAAAAPRRRRRRGGRRHRRVHGATAAGAAAGTPSATPDSGAAAGAAVPAGRGAAARSHPAAPPPPRPAARVAAPRSAPTPPPAAAVSAGEEAALERTHLEQTMFRLAREHAEAAARSASAGPPDREGERMHSLLSVLMAYFAVEAFINMVGQD